jgi:hypothetical protein
LLAQGNGAWIAFWNKDSTLIGFKDKHGKVKIEPKFVSGFTTARIFDNVIAAMEENGGNYQFYYLTQSLKIFGKDSLLFFDNVTDCESEGFIRFRDKKAGSVGMFNRNGKVVIPAEYNALTPVRNGMVIALKGAKKELWENDNHSGCNHFSWVGGNRLLLDTNNKVLVENFQYGNELNLFSLVTSVKPHQDTIRKSFLSADGLYYSFVDFEKEFRRWLNLHLLNNLTKEGLENESFSEVSYWKEPNGWTAVPKREFLQINFELIKAKLLELKTASSEYSIFDEGLNPFIFESELYKEYYNNCGESKGWLYPVKSIVITHRDKKDITQDHFDFLRTDDGYKLISVTIRKGELK